MRTMTNHHVSIFFTLLIFCGASTLSAQDGDDKHQYGPAYRITIVPGSITTISYRARTSADIGFQGSPLLPDAGGQAKAISKQGRTVIHARFEKLDSASHSGPECLTYVMWAITPEGRTHNVGELILDGDKSKLDATTPLQTFGLIVTAEPYYAVVQPSNAVILQNVGTDRTQGTIEQATANYHAFERGGYNYDGTKIKERYLRPASEVPLEVQEVWNAVAIATAEGAQVYAPDALQRAETSGSPHHEADDRRPYRRAQRDPLCRSRWQNRRVEIIISGDIIGQPIGATNGQQPPPQQQQHQQA
jgi:hypothetical protein